jgi:anthranilate phosphoribosyltransferase
MTTPETTPVTLFPAATLSNDLPPAVRVGNFVRKVGKGRTLLKSLARDEAADAFQLLLAGDYTDAQAGAFLQALRIKELSPDELDGMMDSLRACQPGFVPALPPGGFVLNLASDTPRKGGYASLLAAAALAREGMPVGVVRSEPVLSLNRASWDGTWDLLAGVTGAVAGHGAAHGPDCGHEGGGHDDSCAAPHPPASLCVVEGNDLVPPLRGLRKIRAELGFRSCLHTAEKLLNPWTDKTLVLGISHRHYADRMCDHFARRGMTAKILLGNHGTTDLVLHKETEVWEVLPGGAIRTVFFHPDDLGLKPDASLYTLGAFGRWAVEWAQPGHGALGPVLDYHLAFLRYVAGGAPAASPRLEAPPLSPSHPPASPDAALTGGQA